MDGDAITMPRWNYVSRNRLTKPRKPALEVQRERVNKFLDTIMERGKIKDFDLQKDMGWGLGVHERIARIVKTSYADEVEWDKKIRSRRSY